MNVQSVEILDANLDVASKTRLETAIVGAVNIAMRRAIVAAGQALRDYARQRQSSASDDGTEPRARGIRSISPGNVAFSLLV